VNRPDREIAYVEQANKYKQNIVIDYKRKNVIEIDSADPETPDIAANVTPYWKAMSLIKYFISIWCMPASCSGTALAFHLYT
jgi:hypothetical protein